MEDIAIDNGEESGHENSCSSRCADVSDLATVLASNVHEQDGGVSEERLTGATNMANEAAQELRVPFGMLGNEAPMDVRRAIRFRREEQTALFLCTIVGYSLVREGTIFNDTMQALQNGNLDQFQRLAKSNRRDDATWNWPLKVRANQDSFEYKEKPKNWVKRWILRHDKEGQWDYIVKKACKAVNALPRLHLVGNEGTHPFHQKVRLLVRCCESDEAAAFVRIYQDAMALEFGSFATEVVRMIYVFDPQRYDLGRIIGTRSQEGLDSNPSSNLHALEEPPAFNDSLGSQVRSASQDEVSSMTTPTAVADEIANNDAAANNVV